jgi:hypothetical protein
MSDPDLERNIGAILARLSELERRLALVESDMRELAGLSRSVAALTAQLAAGGFRGGGGAPAGAVAAGASLGATAGGAAVAFVFKWLGG